MSDLVKDSKVVDSKEVARETVKKRFLQAKSAETSHVVPNGPEFVDHDNVEAVQEVPEGGAVTSVEKPEETGLCAGGVCALALTAFAASSVSSSAVSDSCPVVEDTADEPEEPVAVDDPVGGGSYEEHDPNQLLKVVQGVEEEDPEEEDEAEVTQDDADENQDAEEENPESDQEDLDEDQEQAELGDDVFEDDFDDGTGAGGESETASKPSRSRKRKTNESGSSTTKPKKSRKRKADTEAEPEEGTVTVADQEDKKKKKPKAPAKPRKCKTPEDTETEPEKKKTSKKKKTETEKEEAPKKKTGGRKRKSTEQEAEKESTEESAVTKTTKSTKPRSRKPKEEASEKTASKAKPKAKAKTQKPKEDDPEATTSDHDDEDDDKETKTKPRSRTKKVVDLPKTLAKYEARLRHTATEDNLKTLTGVYLTDFGLETAVNKWKKAKKQAIDQDDQKDPLYTHQAQVLAALGAEYGFNIKGFTSENKVKGEYKALPNDEVRESEGGTAKVIYVGKPGRGYQETVFTLNGDDVVFE